MTSAMIQTYTLTQTGETVLSKDGEWPTMYTNRAQAYRKAESLKVHGMEATVIQRGRPFYIRIAMRGDGR